MSELELDLALVKRVQKGDKNAFNLLVRKYQHKILSLVGRYIYDHSEREDVAQEAFIRAYRALPNFRGDSAFYTWLYRIAINTAKNHLAARKRRPPAQDIDATEAYIGEQPHALKETNTPEAVAMNDELAAAIRRGLAELPDKLREALEMCEFEGMTYEEIAGIMDCPVGTVRSRIFRARESLEKVMRPYVG